MKNALLILIAVFAMGCGNFWDPRCGSEKEDAPREEIEAEKNE